MKRVITANIEDRSAVLLSAPLGASSLELIWDSDAANPLGSEPQSMTALPKLAPGASSWRLVTLPPFEQMRDLLQAGIPGLDEKGFHRTGTIDHVIVLDGPVTLALEDDEIDLQPGDLVVQRDTNHAWYNRGDHPIRLLCLMTGLA